MNPLRAAIARGARRAGSGGTLPRGTRPGDGYEFDRVREYAEGDDPRRIDWAATARIGALQTRVYLEETMLVLAALVDESPSMAVGRERALRDAADDALRAWFGAAEATDRTRRIVDERVLADRRAAVDARAKAPFDVRRLLEFALRALPAGSSFLFVTDGLDLAGDAAADGLLERAGRRFDATVLLAADPWMEDLPLRGFTRLRDAESGRTRRVFVGPRARERYRNASRARDASLRARFARARWRVEVLDEADGAASLERAFGLR